MRVVSWNVGKRTQQQLAVLEHLDTLGADLALLQESRLHATAQQRGWQVIRAAQSPSDCVILGRGHLNLQRGQPSPVSRLGRYVAHAEWTADGRAVDVFSVHPLAHRVPATALADLPAIDVKRPSDPSVWWSDLFFHLIGQATSGRTAIIAGDWNTSDLFENSLFDRAAARGWCEALRHLHGEQQRTWFRGNDRPHGLDHVFCTSDLRDSVRAAYVDAEVADSAGEHTGRGLSDHAPVIVDLDMSASLQSVM